MIFRKQLSDKRKISYGIAALLICMACYWYLSYRQHQINPTDKTIPTFKQVICAVEIVTHRNLFDNKIWLLEDSIATVWRFITGMAVGVSVSLLLGILMGHFTQLASFFNPIFTFFAKIPPTAAFAIFFVCFGMDEWLYFAVIIFCVIPNLSQSIYITTTKDVKAAEINKLLTYNASACEVMYELSFKKILPKVIGDIRLIIGPVMITLIATEWFTGQVGFGYTLKMQTGKANMDVVYLYLLILGVWGIMVDYCLVMLSKFACSWAEKER